MPITCYNVIAVVPSYEDSDLKIERRASEIRSRTVEELSDSLTSLGQQVLDELILLVATKEVESEKRDSSLIKWENSQ